MAVETRYRLMRIPAAVLLTVALATGLTPATAGQIGVPAAPAAGRPVRAPAEPSDLLTHSPLAACRTGDAPLADAPTRSRVATWNIRAARSAPVDAIAAELRAMQADVIALQEVDVRMRRTGFVDEPVALASALGFHHVFAASIKWDEGDYGLAVLSRWPLAEVRRHRLDATAAAEPRIVLEVTVCAGGRPLRSSIITRMAASRRGMPGSQAERDRAGWVGRGILVQAISASARTLPACAG